MMIVGLARAPRQSRYCTYRYCTSSITKELHLLYLNHDGDRLNHVSKRQSSSSSVWKNIKKNMSKKQLQQLYPTRCPCCDTAAIDSIHNCVNHLSSNKHIAKIKEMFNIKDECRPNIVSMFTFPFALIKSKKGQLSLDGIDVIASNEDQYIYAGQRIKYMLPLVLDNQKVLSAIERPVMMSFSEDDKLPLSSPAPPGSSVVPPDFSHI